MGAVPKVAAKLIFTVRVLAVLACWFPFRVPASAQIMKLSVLEQFRLQQQHFSCTPEYPQEKCLRDLQQIRRLLDRYDAGSLGEWQWVIISRSEWKPFCANLGIDLASPAMTSFVDHQTFLDEALFDSFPDRTSELVRKFNTPWRDLLALALSHELGLAACQNVTEIRAEAFAEELRHGRSGRCQATIAMPIWFYRAAPSR
jgi:hypothetical protein